MPKLWFRQPAERFEESLPIGAGRFGATLSGRPDCELLQLNEDSVWSGGPRSRLNPDAAEGFREVRALLRSGNIAKAEQIVFQKMQGCPQDMRHYMPLGNLRVKLTLPDGEPEHYRRELDLDNAVYAVSFEIGGHQFRREVIASAPADCILMRFTSDIPVTLSAAFDGRDDYYDENCISRCDEGLYLEFNGGSGTKDGIRFDSALCAKSSDGCVTSCGNRLIVRDCTEALLAFSVYTNYYHPQENCRQLARSTGAAALGHTWAELLAEHTADYHALFSRTALTLPDDNAEDCPTDQMLNAVKAGDFTYRNALLSAYFSFGRYLMISGSRKGSLPLNLQGIWNKDMWPAWGCRFTVNINTEMNYWPAESCNLPECHLPLFDLLKRVAENGEKTAREMYGQAGFCCHHNTDLWGDTAPQDLWMPATIWPVGGAWLALHIMEHYRYTKDADFLRDNLPVLHGAAQFFTGYLTENAAGQLITSPSVSPENTYRTESGEEGSLCEGPSMDSQIISQLYQDVIDADEALGMHHAITDTVRAQLPRIPKPQIGKYGQIMEWAVDYDEVEPGHRHISQLFALHPAHMISPRKTPELSKAAEATLHRRLTHGGGHTGWSCAWIANMYARLCDSGHFMETMTKLMQHSTNPNLFDMHPPFQIDGNFGGTAAIAEALLQSDRDGITLLPACPAEWDSGAFRGLCAYGGFVVSARWEQRRITELEIESKCGGVCRLLPGGAFRITDGSGTPITTRKETDGFLCFDTVQGGIYRLTAV
ncbi:MAG: glycoside hydrolase family 95 protein [Oscillospiraceae bacterium]|nr:glycoside hydrolase family 95 protein [Oscillospiraceae bacterium]